MLRMSFTRPACALRAGNIAKQREEELSRTRPLRVMDDIPKELERTGPIYGSARREVPLDQGGSDD